MLPLLALSDTMRDKLGTLRLRSARNSHTAALVFESHHFALNG